MLGARLYKAGGKPRRITRRLNSGGKETRLRPDFGLVGGKRQCLPLERHRVQVHSQKVSDERPSLLLALPCETRRGRRARRGRAPVRLCANHPSAQPLIGKKRRVKRQPKLQAAAVLREGRQRQTRLNALGAFFQRVIIRIGGQVWRRLKLRSGDSVRRR